LGAYEVKACPLQGTESNISNPYVLYTIPPIGLTGELKERAEVARRILTLSGEKFLLSKEDLYMQLSERYGADMIYQSTRRFLNTDREQLTHKHVSLVLLNFVDAVKCGRVSIAGFRRYVSGQDAETISANMQAFQEEQVKRGDVSSLLV
jgi:hypothetical protein